MAWVRFNDSSAIHAPLDEQPCRSRLALTSLSLCFQVNCPADSRKAALDDIDSTCRQRLGSPRPSVGANFTHHDVAHVPRIHKNDAFGPDRPLGQVAIPSTQLFTAWYQTLDAADYVHHSIILFWAAVLVLGISNKLVLLLCMVRRGASAQASSLAKAKRWLKRTLLMPAPFGYPAHNVWWATIPPRCQSMTLALFIVANLAFCLSGYRFVADNMYFPTLRSQVLRYVADRTGILCYANFPLIWVFGMRNNFAIWLTGWNHTTYNDFHRWVARIAILEAVVHSAGYTALILQGKFDTLAVFSLAIETGSRLCTAPPETDGPNSGGWAYYSWYFTRLFWNLGVLRTKATVAMCALLAFSMAWMRRNRYETFLLVHIGLSAVLLLAMLGHVSIFQGQYNAIFWACVYIWAFDRLMRLLRITAFNPLSWATDARAVYDDSANILRLSVPLKSVYKVHPGSYFYLMVLNASRCWESHPFTAVCVADSDRHSLCDQQTPLLECQRQALQFIIRPYNGFTRRLRDMAVKGTKLRLVVEGPYGHSRPLHGYDHVVFIVGGSGVVTALSYMASLSSFSSLSNNRAGPRSIHLHWAVRQVAFAEQVVLNHLCHVGIKLSVDIYLAELSRLNRLAAVTGVCLHAGRLEIASIVTTATAAAGPLSSVAIVACGPASMVDDARSAVVEALAHAQCQMDYFEESW
ncbi:hypothetical protein CDD82_5874 [Ophiocordyceps australis]|uniref:FAD-binding FR-type domain-containing protein n=1 Tax=Ophiocordyceps australis TaxID=1399860 RepID=A0A2C5YZ36_9HYPO|nr:hypothetical protein CDD82_5874 [Ophiocordyceps australis]